MEDGQGEENVKVSIEALNQLHAAHYFSKKG